MAEEIIIILLILLLATKLQFNISIFATTVEHIIGSFAFSVGFAVVGLVPYQSSLVIYLVTLGFIYCCSVVVDGETTI